MRKKVFVAGMMVWLLYGAVLSHAGIPADIDTHMVLYKEDGIYASFPNLFIAPDGRWTIRHNTLAQAGHLAPGASRTVFSANEGRTWAETGELHISANWVKPNEKLATANGGGWVIVDESERAALEAAHRVVDDTNLPEGQIAYLADPVYSVSLNGGENWSEYPVTLPEDLIGSMELQKGSSEIVTSTGIHLVAIYGNRWRVTPEYPEGLQSWEVYFLRSADEGNTWTCIPQIPGGMDPNTHPSGGLNETAIVENEAGEIIALSRSVAGANTYKLFQSISTDGGLTWSAPVDTGIIGSPPNLVKLTDGRILCTYGYRTNPAAILARISSDGGHTWPGTAQEIIIRNNLPYYWDWYDYGYPQTLQKEDGSFFTVYYMKDSSAIVHVAATHWRTQVYPAPYDQAEDVPVDAGLEWLADTNALSYNVYFGTDSSPDAGEFAGNQAGTVYDPGVLSSNTAYYWRIDKVTASGTLTGAVWSFETEDGLRELEVSSPYGAPNPSVGVHSFPAGNPVQCTVPSPVVTLGTTRMAVAGWSGFGSVPLSGATNDVGTLTLGEDSLIEWLWETDSYWLSATNETAGGIVPSVSGWHTNGASVMITAVPDTGYVLRYWRGDVPPGEQFANPLILAMDGPKSVSAVFDPDPGANTVNTLPYTEPFENYATGAWLAGTNGWSAGRWDAARVSTNAAMITALTGSYSGGFPITTTHFQVLETFFETTNSFDSGTAEQVEVDCIIALPVRTEAPELPVSEQTACYLDGSGHLNIMHARTADGISFTNEWLALTGGPVLAADEWVRLTLVFDYADKMFQIRLNDGAALSAPDGWSNAGGTQPGSWFYMANRTGTGLKKIRVGRKVWLDDLRAEDMAASSGLNTIPYAEPFEEYDPGFQLPGTNGWSAVRSDASRISTNETMIASLTGSYSGGFPLATSHTQVMETFFETTNSIVSGTAEHVKVDCIVALPVRTEAPELPVSEQAACYLDGSGHLNIMHARTLDGASFTNEWLALANEPVLAADEWVRLTLIMDYTDKMFQIRLNDGAALSAPDGWTGAGGTRPGNWFYMANRTGTGLEKIRVGRKVWLDDLRVDSAFNLAVSAGIGGGAAPGGGWYSAGANVDITASPETYYQFGTWMGSIGAITVGTVTDPAITVTMNDPVTLNAEFEADTTSGGTPHWWLAQENPVWTNDFEAAADDDFDGDGAVTSNEYVAGTDSTDSNSVFRVHITGDTVSFQTVETTPQHGGLDRRYSLQSRTNLIGGADWAGVSGYTNIPGSGQDVLYTNSTPASTGFFRVRAWLE